MARPLDYREIPSGGLLSFLGANPPGWPEWVRRLNGRSGAYVIRDRVSKAVLYVGESHTARLYDTLTRHFQAWIGKTAGPTYSRGAVEVAIRLTPPGTALAAQDALIRRLHPRDNSKTNGDPF